MYKLLLFLSLLVAPALAQQTHAYPNIHTNISGWSLCALGSCSGAGTPGGNGVAVSPAFSVGNASPSLSGSSGILSMVAPAATQGTNILETKKIGAHDEAIALSFDVWVFIPSNVALFGQFEFDQFIFSQTDNVEYMFGTQCNITEGKWDVFDQNAGTWVATTSTCDFGSRGGTWVRVQETAHRVYGDTNGCSGFPCMYYDSLSINGVGQSGYAAVKAAGVLPGGFTSNCGFQYQFNILPAGSSGATVFEAIDLANFSFTPVGSALGNGVNISGGATIK